MANVAPVSKLARVAFSSRRMGRKENKILRDCDPGDFNQDLQMCMSSLLFGHGSSISRSIVAIASLAECPGSCKLRVLRPRFDHHRENIEFRQ
jgi:hypothetical protein